MYECHFNSPTEVLAIFPCIALTGILASRNFNVSASSLTAGYLELTWPHSEWNTKAT